MRQFWRQNFYRHLSNFTLEQSMWTHFDGLSTELSPKTFYDILIRHFKKTQKVTFFEIWTKRKIRILERWCTMPEMMMMMMRMMCAVGPAWRKNESIGIMFLCEVALGKEHTTLVGGGSIKSAPKGYDSIVARGRTEPGNAYIHTYLKCSSAQYT